ncbi:MAG: tetratricopeptide repeat protein [Moraxellaceae bacterium]|nr:tetratricopeptide repeat protein [Moraxellaceae bacterium]
MSNKKTENKPEKDSGNMNDKQAMQALKQHGGNIVWAIIIVLAGYFGWSYIQKNTVAKVDTSVSDSYMQIADLQQKVIAEKNIPIADDKAKQSLAKQEQQLKADIDKLVAEHGDNVYAWQALMVQAKQFMDNNDSKSAVPILKSASEIKIDDLGLKAITRLRYAQALLANGQVDEAKTEATKEVAGSFEASKQELLGDIYLAKNDKGMAIRSYQNAWKLLEKRQENRPILLLKMQKLGIDVKPIEAKELFISKKATTQDLPAQNEKTEETVKTE